MPLHQLLLLLYNYWIKGVTVWTLLSRYVIVVFLYNGCPVNLTAIISASDRLKVFLWFSVLIIHNQLIKFECKLIQAQCRFANWLDFLWTLVYSSGQLYYLGLIIHTQDVQTELEYANKEFHSARNGKLYSLKKNTKAFTYRG